VDIARNAFVVAESKLVVLDSSLTEEEQHSVSIDTAPVFADIVTAFEEVGEYELALSAGNYLMTFLSLHCGEESNATSLAHARFRAIRRKTSIVPNLVSLGFDQHAVEEAIDLLGDTVGDGDAAGSERVAEFLCCEEAEQTELFNEARKRSSDVREQTDKLKDKSTDKLAKQIVPDFLSIWVDDKDLRPRRGLALTQRFNSPSSDLRFRLEYDGTCDNCGESPLFAGRVMCERCPEAQLCFGCDPTGVHSCGGKTTQKLEVGADLTVPDQVAADGEEAEDEELAKAMALSLEQDSAPPPSRPPPSSPYEQVFDHLLRLYPTQQDPVQLTAQLKWWLGGPDPLDYISVFVNPGVPGGMPPHWHFVSHGFSDMKGDGSMFKPPRFREPSPDGPSGFGYEMTLRLACRPGDQLPMWPAVLLNTLARYVWHCSAIITPGDPIPHLAAKHLPDLPHCLVTEDPSLPPVSTMSGTVHFFQLLLVKDDEFAAANSWTSRGIIALLRDWERVGPNHLIVPGRESVLEANPSAADVINAGVAQDGSNLGYITALFNWAGDTQPSVAPADSPASSAVWKCSVCTLDNDATSTACDACETPRPTAGGAQVSMEKVTITVDTKTAEIFPGVMRGRMMHARSFVFTDGGVKPDGVERRLVLVTAEITENIYAGMGVAPPVASVDDPLIQTQPGELQIFLTRAGAEAMANTLDRPGLFQLAHLPLSLTWEEVPGLTLVVTTEDEIQC